jgi:pilus assembly protein CpaE
VAVHDGLAAAGFEAVRAETGDELEQLLGSRNDIRVVILDCENDFDRTLEMYALLHEAGRNIPALILMPPLTLGRMTLSGRNDFTDEYFARPFSAESLRWRLEAMLIRIDNIPVQEAPAVGPILAAQAFGPSVPNVEAVSEPQHGRLIIVFNPKGGVGKTTVSINLGSALQIRKSQRVLLVDCDTVTGHIASSLGLPRVRTLADAWQEDARTGMNESVAQIATSHPSGVDVLVMSATPLHTEVLEPARVAAAIAAARASYDFVILDLHPDFGPLNVALFELADRIIVPVTPDVACILAAVQFREVATALEMRDRLLMVINRANSGVAPSRVERAVRIPTLARIRSAGMLFVQASDAGKSAVERSPSAKAIGDIDRLADRLLAAVGAGEHGRRGGIAGSVRNLFDRLTGQT